MGDDGEPNVVRPDDEVVVLAVGLNGCADKAILGGVGGGGFRLGGGEGGLKQCAALFGFFAAGSFQMVEGGVGGLEMGGDWRAGMGGGVNRDGHGDESGVWTDFYFL